MLLSIQEQMEQLILKDKNYSLININNGDLGEILFSESERLKGLIEEEIDAYYTSYTPHVYKRHEVNSMKKMLRIKQNKTNSKVTIYFDPYASWGESYVDFSAESGFIPLLIDQGWQVGDNVSFREIKMFGYYEGFHFIEKAIKRFFNNNPYRLKVQVSCSYEGKAVRKYTAINKTRG